MDERAKVLRARIRKAAGRKPSHRRRYPAELRRDAGRYAAERCRSGSSVKRVAAELGLSAPTLGIWTQEYRDNQPAIRPVAVAEANPASSAVLVTPQGYRIEGLGLAEISELLRALG